MHENDVKAFYNKVYNPVDALHQKTNSLHPAIDSGLAAVMGFLDVLDIYADDIAEVSNLFAPKAKESPAQPEDAPVDTEPVGDVKEPVSLDTMRLALYKHYSYDKGSIEAVSKWSDVNVRFMYDLLLVDNYLSGRHGA